MDLSAVDEFLPASEHTWQPGDAFLAGGTWLFSVPQPTVRRLLDLQAFGWPPLRPTDDGLEIAATCTLAELAAWPDAPPLFGECCDALLGSFKIWNEATVGGNLCLALPAGPMTALAVALDGECELWAADGAHRRVAAVDFVIGPGRTALRPGEILRAIHLPHRALAARTALRQMSLATYGRSSVLVIARQADADLVLTITASVPRPVQVRVRPGADAVAAVRAAVGAWFEDVHGSAAWRAAMTARLVSEVAVALAQ